MHAARRSLLAMLVVCVAAAPAWAQTPIWDLQRGCVFSWTISKAVIYIRDASTNEVVRIEAPLPGPITWSLPCPTKSGFYTMTSAAVGPDGAEGMRSQANAFIIEPFPPPPPASPSVGGDLTSNNLTWVNVAPNATGNRIYRKTETCNGPSPVVLLTEIPPEATAYTDTPVMTGTYCYRLTAFNAVGESAFSNPAERTILPPAPVFAVGARIQVNTAVGQLLNVRAVPNGLPILGTQRKGASGTILAGPTVAGGATWWQIDYGTGADGWSSQGFLVVVP